jgi:hypothetical protein
LGSAESEELRLRLLRILEIALLVPAFGFLVPPVLSTPEPNRLFPGIAFAVCFFSASLFLTYRRGAETWATAAAKLLLFVCFGWVLLERVKL